MAFVEALRSIFSAEALYVSAFQLSVVFVFAASGEWVAERAGTLNISVEAMLLAGAFGAALGVHWVSSGAMGLLVGCTGGLLVALVQANLSHRLTANQFVVGLALNVLVLGLTAYLDTVIDLGRAKSETLRVPMLSDVPLLGGRSSPARGRAISPTPSSPPCGSWCSVRDGASRSER